MFAVALGFVREKGRLLPVLQAASVRGVDETPLTGTIFCLLSAALCCMEL